MNLPSASTQTTVDAQPRSEADIRLRGHWLVLVRVVWVVIAALTLGLIIASIPSYFAFLHVVCTGAFAVCRNNGQLNPNDLRAFQALGLSLDFYATYELALYIVFTVGYAAIGAVIFWRKSQEALHNTVKHARASKVELRLDQTSEVVVLEVCDNGRGFDATASFPGHLGLHSMQERVKGLGGELQIESVPGQRTCIRAQVPAREVI